MARGIDTAGGNASPDTKAWLKEIYDGVDRMDAEAFGAALAPDVRLTWGNQPAVNGRDGVVEAIGGFFGTIAGLEHRFVNVWEHGDDIIVEWQVTYTRQDGGTAVVPATTLLERGPDGARTCRVHVDLAPVYEPAPTVPA